MKRLDQFILKSFVGPFFAILFVVIFILMMQFLWLYIDELVGKGLGLGIVAEFLLWGCCTILPMALPLATLLASMMTMGQLSENNELMAMKASGISLARVMTPLIVSSLIISVGTYYASNNLVPYSFNKIYMLRDDIGRTKSEIKIPAGTFYDGIDGYILRVESTDDRSNMMYDVMVYDHSQNKGNTTLTLADSAMMKMSKAKDYLTFTLYNGTNYQETNTMQYRDTTLQLQRVDFTRQDLIVPLENYAFQKTDDDRFAGQTKSMNIGQLRHQRDSLTQVESTIHEAQFTNLISDGSLTKYKQLDTAFIAQEHREFKDSLLMAWADQEQEYRAYDRAATRAEQLANTLEMDGRESYECTFYLRRSRLEIFKKYSVALACFLLFFIGAPIGALIRKGGLGVPAIISVLFFVLYWVVDISGTKLAKDGAMSPFNGAFISAYVLGPIGAFLSYKAIKDATFSAGDSFKSELRRLKSKFMSIFRKTRIVYMGTPDFAVGPLDSLVQNKYKVVGVVTVADKPSGRGLKLTQSPVKQYALAHDIPVLQPTRLKDPEFLQSLAALKADLFVVVAFRMLPEEVWSMPRLGTFNLHAALLPQYRGAAPINWAVINGENMTGVTTFMIDHDIDTGGIILRQEHRISQTDTAGDVHDALMELGSQLVVETVEGIIQGNVEMRVQRSFIMGSEALKPAPKLTRELCHIDWNDTTRSIYNLIRGLSPYPAAYTEIYRSEGGEKPVQLKIYSCECYTPDSVGEPGDIICDGRELLAVRTIDGAIKIDELQVSGKRRMSTHDFLLGFREMESYHTTDGTSKAERLRLCSK